MRYKDTHSSLNLSDYPERAFFIMTQKQFYITYMDQFCSNGHELLKCLSDIENGTLRYFDYNQL